MFDVKKIIVPLLFAVLLVGCAPSEPKEQSSSTPAQTEQTNPTVNPDAIQPKYYAEFNEVIGENISVVAKHLGLQEDNLQFVDSYKAYVCKDKVEYMGQSFNLYLYASREADGPIYAIGYRTTFDNAQKAAAAAIDLRNKLQENYYQIGEESKNTKNVSELVEIKETELAKSLAGEKFWSESLTWSLTTDLSHIDQEVQEMFMAKSITLEMEVIYLPESDRTEIDSEPIYIGLKYKLSQTA